MARVRWKSSTCGTCHRRKIKCDKSAPVCRNCQRTGLICERRYYPGNRVHITTQHPPPLAMVTWPIHQPSHTRDHHHMPPAWDGSRNMDSRLEPNLSRQAINTQEHEFFRWFVADNFPMLFSHDVPHTNMTWVDLVRRPQDHQPEFMEWAIRSVSTLYVGQMRGCKSMVRMSHQQYGQALFTFRNNLLPTNKSDMLAAAILLALFEMEAGQSHISWLPHATGIETIMTINGPNVYSTGFERTLFLIFRPFLIRAALLQGKACFLEGAEWITMAENTMHEEQEQRKGIGYPFTALLEHFFTVTVKAPGLLARTRALRNPVNANTFTSEETLIQLRNDISSWIDQLNELERELSDRKREFLDPNADKNRIKWYLGTVPSHIGVNIAQQLMSGIRGTRSLLQGHQHQYPLPPANAIPRPTWRTKGLGSQTASRTHIIAGLSDGITQESGWFDGCAPLAMHKMPYER